MMRTSLPTSIHHQRPAPRGAVIIIVIWTIAVAAILAASVQLLCFRQATIGRDSIARVQARWAARAGIENTMAVMANHTESPILNDARAMTLDMEVASTGTVGTASWDIRHHADGRDRPGPMDEHSKMNINGTDNAGFAILRDITPDVISAIADWRDDDDEPSLFGAESDYYLGTYSYQPRNGAMHNVAELELVAGIYDAYLRNEDANLNGRLDPNERDGDRTMPRDNGDNQLDAGWSAWLTAHSVDGGATASGLPRLYLRRTEPEELVERCGVDQRQADVLISFGQNDGSNLLDLISTPLDSMAGGGGGQQGGGGGGIAGGGGGSGGGAATGGAGGVEALSDEQLASVLAETSIQPLYVRRPGRINLNTVPPDLLRDFLELRGVDEAIVDEIVYMRTRPEGIVSIIDLLDIPSMDRSMVRQFANWFDTQSNVFTISSIGKSAITGTEVEIIAVVDRSTLPVRILEYREQ